MTLRAVRVRDNELKLAHVLDLENNAMHTNNWPSISQLFISIIVIKVYGTSTIDTICSLYRDNLNKPNGSQIVLL